MPRFKHLRNIRRNPDVSLGRICDITLLSRGPAKWLGTISYGVYLFHFPVIVGLRMTGHWPQGCSRASCSPCWRSRCRPRRSAGWSWSAPRSAGRSGGPAAVGPPRRLRLARPRPSRVASAPASGPCCARSPRAQARAATADQRSTIATTPWPPAAQTEISARPEPFSASILAAVARMRPPVAANGWPAASDRAVDVQLVAVDRAQRPVEAEVRLAELSVFPGSERGEHLRGERLVDLEEVEVVERQARAGEHLRDGVDRGHQQPLVAVDVGHGRGLGVRRGRRAPAGAARRPTRRSPAGPSTRRRTAASSCPPSSSRPPRRRRRRA